MAFIFHGIISLVKTLMWGTGILAGTAAVGLMLTKPTDDSLYLILASSNRNQSVVNIAETAMILTAKAMYKVNMRDYIVCKLAEVTPRASKERKFYLGIGHFWIPINPKND